MTKIKICGLSRLADIEAVNAARPGYIGFVFAESRRKVTPAEAARLKARLSPAILTVGVFVNTPPETILSLTAAGIIDWIQLHGSESPETIRFLKEKSGRPVLKAFSIQTPTDLELAAATSADFPLLDNGKGGTGETFDWELLSHFPRPYFLAGGLTPENLPEAIFRFSPYAVDLSSGVETDGKKDPQKIFRAVEAAHRKD